MTLLEHLRELRGRLFKAVLSIVVVAIGAAFFYNELFHLLTDPFNETVDKLAAERELDAQLTINDVAGPFMLQLKISLVAGLVIASPVWLWQLWAFVVPGLLPRERKFALPFVIVATLFFYVGAAFALTVIVPFALNFLVSYKTQNLVATISVNRYVDFVLKFTIAFGVVFEVPLAITLGSRLGLVTPEFLGRNRKYAVLLCAVAAAIQSPHSAAMAISLVHSGANENTPSR